MKRFLLIVLMILAGMALCSHAVALDVPLPKDILIIPPDPNLPPEIRALSGKWGDRWWVPGSMSYGVDAILVVEKISSERQATMISCVGDSVEWKIDRGCSERLEIDISRSEDGTIIFSIPTSSRFPSNITFRLKGGKLEGRGTRSYITMKRIQ